MAEPVELRMPSLGADMEAGTVVEWHVGVGDHIAVGDLIALVDTDKAEIDIESFEAGVLQRIVVPAGEKVPVGTVIAVLGSSAPAGVPPASPSTPAAPARPPAAPARPPAAPAGPPASGAAASEGTDATPPQAPPPPPSPDAGRVVSPLVRRLAAARHVDLEHLPGSGPGHRVTRHDVETAPTLPVGRRPVSPRARRLAAEAGLDVAAIAGSGPDGAVTGEDVQRTVRSARRGPSEAPTLATATVAPTPAATGAAAPTPAHPAPRQSGADGRMRAAIAALMSRSWQEIPHYRLATRVELSAALSWLSQRNEDRPPSRRVLPAALLLHATARAAARHRNLNGWWDEQGFRPSERVDLGTVVGLRGGGLLAPTIPDAAGLSLDETMDALRDVVARARRGRLRSSDTTPASITVTNLGELGVDEVHGIIHPPQVALVGFGAIHEEAWAKDGTLAARPVVHLTLAGDHRASDGLAGAAFLADIANLLNDPEKL